MPHLYPAVLARRYGKTWIFGKTHLVNITPVVKHALRKGGIRPPQNHQPICRATQEVVSRRIEMHLPDSFGMAAVFSKQNLQSKAPKFHPFVHSPSDEVELI